MDYNKKSLKVAAKITAGTLSESGKLDPESAKETLKFLKTVYGEISSLCEEENFAKTIDQGLQMLQSIIDDSSVKMLSGVVAALR